MSRSVASTRLSAQTRSASRPNRRISSTKRSSAASASFNSPSSPSTATKIDVTRLRSSGCARIAAISASSLNSAPSIRILPPNQSKPNLSCIALNRTPSNEGVSCALSDFGPINPRRDRGKIMTPNLLVTSQIDKTVREYNGTTGAFVKVAAAGGALGDPLGLATGLDGDLLVSDGQTNQVKRFDSAAGAFLNVFASTGLAAPEGMTVHQGVLYVANSNPPQGVQQFDAATGMNTGNFVPSLTNPSSRDVKVNPTNNRLYVLYYNAATVETFDLTTRASFGLLMPAGSPIGSGGLYTPSAMAFGPDGNLYISGGTFGGNLGVRRYNPA